MVTSIARQSVIIKCNMQQSILLGNYEFYYAAGLAKKLYGLQLDGDMQPAELFTGLTEQMEGLAPQDEREKYLLSMIKNYEVLEEYDEQMKELFDWGEKEPDLWSVTTGYQP